MKGTALKLVRYFCTAGVAAIVDVGGFAALSLTPLPIPVSAVISFCVATVVNYLLTSRFAFHRAPTLPGYGLFFVSALGGLLVNVTLTTAGSLYLGIAPVLAKILGVGAAFLVNFWLNLRVVFRDQGSM
jgi:putative flippase GtrA